MARTIVLGTLTASPDRSTIELTLSLLNAIKNDIELSIRNGMNVTNINELNGIAITPEFIV
ncbi:MAG: hypothetical protein DRP42_04270 [Tenericutes bacterium]|nr:MAG: hypothetical protein DRP42_04270 [Mycoplasmatota bacterium]